MPAFKEDKLSVSDARAIAEFLRSPAPDAAMAVQSIVTPTVLPPAAVIKAEPAVDAPAPVKTRPEKTRKEIKPAKEKKSRLQSFVKKWTIKGLRNGEEITFQNFEITADANNKLTVIPSSKLSDYAIKVTAFEIADKTLKLQLNWTWKNSPSYWKIETYELSLSDDGKKLSGSYNLRASGGQSVSSSVWGE